MSQASNQNNVSKYPAIVLDDHLLFAESFSNLIKNTGFFKEVLSFSEPDELLKYLENTTNPHPPFLFLDYYLRDKTIPPVISEIRRLHKNAKIIITSSADTPTLLRSLVDLKVDAILHKSSSLEETTECLYNVAMGKTYYTPYIEDIIKKSVFSESAEILTPREIEILEYFAKGHTVDETAKLMYLSRHTIAAHRRKMFVKTDSKNITDLLNYARSFKLIKN